MVRDLQTIPVINLNQNPLSSKAFFDTPAKKVNQGKQNDKLTETITIRIDAQQARVIDELLGVLRSEGSASLRTRSDVFRWATDAAVIWLEEEVSGVLAGDSRYSWLRDHITLDRLDRELEERKEVTGRVANEIRLIKEFTKDCIAAGNYSAAGVSLNRLSETANTVSDKIWSTVFWTTLTNDVELAVMIKQVREHGVYVHLLDPDLDEGGD